MLHATPNVAIVLAVAASNIFMTYSMQKTTNIICCMNRSGASKEAACHISTHTSKHETHMHTFSVFKYACECGYAFFFTVSCVRCKQKLTYR